MLHVRSFTLNPIQENTYFVFNETGDCAIIDPGCYFDEEKQELSQFIAAHTLKPQLLLNTHCHLDHVFGNKYIAETYELELHVHPLEKQLLEMAPASGLMYNMPFDNYQGPLHDLIPDQIIKLGNDELRCLFTPGHSPGSISFYSAAQGFVISGDVLFSGSVGRTDLPGGDMKILLNSIQTQLLTLPDETIVYSGHGPATTIGMERAQNPYLR
jgi:glyoxylase-like metal-dependent hydrolase (beta-lactamase superfamily II)